MKRVFRKIVVITIIAITCMQLAACGKTEQTLGDELSKYVYVPEYQDLPGAKSLQSITIVKDKLIYTNNDWDEETGISSITLNVLRFGETVPSEIPISLGENSYIYNMGGDQDGNILLLTNKYIVDESNEMGGTSVFELIKIDEKGNPISNIDITYLLDKEENKYFQNMEIDGKGNIYLTNSDSSIWVLDPDGTLLFILPLDNWINSIGVNKDGLVVISSYGNNGEEMKEIDVATKSFGTTYKELPSSNGNMPIVPGLNSGILINSGNTLIEYDFDTKEETMILDWIDCDIDSNNIRAVSALEDGRIAVITVDYSNAEGETEIIYLTKKESSQVKTNTILTYGTMSLNYDVRSAIIKFNKTNENYRIQVKEYANGYDDYEAALTQFNSDITAGNGPDIIDLTYGFSIKRYASKGIFEDLYPYIEKDSEINLDEYLKNMVKAYEVDGKLYGIMSNFYINTLIGKTSEVGKEKGWNIDGLMAFYEKYPAGTSLMGGATKSSILSTVLMYNMDKYVDWNTGKCSFNSDSFQKVLELANKFDADYNYNQDSPSEPSLIQSGKQLLMNTSITDMQQFQMCKLMFGEEVTFIGFPTETGNGSMITPNNVSMSMNTNSKNKDGAWEFMGYFLSKEYQNRKNSWGFPVLKEALDNMLKESMESNSYEDENGELVIQPKTSWQYDDWKADIYAATEEEVAQLKDLFDSVDTISSYDQEMYSIISEESEAFFSGSKNAKEVTEIIQSRVQIYVNETK
ncbi:MAG TPA: extracellular solute-binding protein [Lachnospiraceae bacterium]|nr:extracellular solute-binding protein [Lachnospiraceae bacterium]